MIWVHIKLSKIIIYILCVSVVFDKKIPQKHINLTQVEAVNIHPSRLSEMRTGDSSFWNILLEKK